MSLGALVILSSCSTTPRPISEVEEFEPATPVIKKPAVKTYGVDLNIEETNESRQLLKESPKVSSIQDPPPPVQPPAQTKDLVRLFELEIAVERSYNKEALLDDFIDYATTYKDADVAGRAYELSQEIHSSSRALAVAALWYQLDRSSNEAQNAYIKELILQSKYEIAFRLMEENHRKGVPVDFHLIALFSQAENEEEARQLIQSYEFYIQRYSELSENLNNGLQIARYRLGTFLFYQTELDKALRVFNLIISSADTTDKTHSGAQAFKSRIYYLLNRTGSEAFYEQALKDNPANLQILVYYALYLFDNNKKEQAEEILLQLLPLAQQEPNEQKIFLLAHLGQQLNLTGLREETLNYYQHFLEEKDTAALRLGILAMKNDSPDLAEDFFQLVNPSFSLWSATQLLRLKNSMATADLASGKSLLEEIFLQDQEAYSSIARQYALELARQGARVAAISVLDEAEKRQPQSEAFFLAKAFAYYELNDLAAMVKEFEQVLADNPDNPTVLNSYGYSLADKELQLNKAQEMIEQAVAENPLSPAYIDSLGWVHYRLNNLQRAHELLSWAYRNDQDGEIAAHLGEVLWKQGKRERARVVWLSSYENQPNSAVLRKTMTRFKINWQQLNPHIDLLSPDI